MKIETLKPGMTVWQVGRHRMGNTTLSTVSVWPVVIVSVNPDHQTVVANFNHNASTTYYRNQWSTWRKEKPLLIRTFFGAYRLANRKEIAAARLSATGKP